MLIIFLYLIILILFLLVTFFGLGPVLFADGSRNERIITLIVVLLIYLGLILVTIVLRKLIKKRSKL